MGYRAQINGITIEMDTADDVRALLAGKDHGIQKVERKRSMERRPRTTSATDSTVEERVHQLVGLLDDKPKKALALLAKGDMEDAALRDALGLKGKRDLVGVFLSISKRAKSVGLSYREVVSVDVSGYKDRKRQFKYSLVPAIKEALLSAA